jgi:hypothetical protein
MIYHEHSSYKPDCIPAKQLVFCRREVQFNKIHPPYYHVYTISVLQKYKARRRDKNIFQMKTTNKTRQQQNKKNKTIRKH